MDTTIFESGILLNRYEKKTRYFLYAIVTWTIGINFLQILGGGHIWKTGDWLINYQAGFIRRGLIGEILYSVSPEGWLLMLTFFTQSIIYIAICHFVLEEFFSKKRGLIDGIIIFSPAFIFLFPFYHINGGMRKELIAFLSFILLLEATKKSKNNWLLLLSLAIFTSGVFSHEMISLFVIFYIYAFLKRSSHSYNQKIAYILLLIVISLSGIYLASIFHGNIATAYSICTSLTLKGVDFDICEGAISALSGTALSEILDVGSRFPGQFIYFPLFALSFMPICFIDWRKYFPIIFFGFISVLPLFIVATDWGRWIHIYITFLFLLYIYDDTDFVKPGITKSVFVFFVFYLVSWRLPAYDLDLVSVCGAFIIPYNIWQVLSEIIPSVL